ncbi:hypothetical protein BJD99_04180 [Rhodococcus sp. 1163]|uniref:DUF6924 domain-containing protein n=1 Tax=Rhodococcus sp. 1163 TaxID=1905289 RepID=UPI000A023E83|nr:hypothetical protein [Rhodococcus sp. 1163]ORI19397.1 hypothetical protein BJD99_04180 [Rhodococcus sp. 1163]
MVRTLPEGQFLLIRTGFEDENAWQTLQVEAQADFTIVDDPEFDGISIEELVEVAGGSLDYAFVADHRTFTDPRRPILVVDLHVRDEDGDVYVDDESEDAVEEPISRFRVTPEYLAVVENNLSTANLDFADFIASADRGGLFDGYAAPAETLTLERRDLLAAARNSNLPAMLVTRYSEALELYRRSTVTATPTEDLSEHHKYLQNNMEGFGHAEEVLGLEESLEISAQGGGPVLAFYFPIRSGWWSANVAPETLAPVTLLMSRMASRRPSTS